jgi:hypothetical protein
MCRTFKESLSSGLVSTATALILLSQGKPAYIWLGTFIFTIGLTQYIDAYVWYNGLENSQDVVRYGISTILALEPIVVYCGLVYTLGFRFPILYEVSIGLFSLGILYDWWVVSCKKGTTISEDGFLVWCENTPNIPGRIGLYLFLIIPFFWFPDLFIRILAILVFTFTFIYSMPKRAFGANWCHYANILSVLSLVRLLFK